MKVLKEEQQRTGVQLLWGTACLFAHPRFAHGAATSCNADVFAYAAAQVKGHRSDAHAQRRRLRVLGRARRLQHAAQHQPEARDGSLGQVSAHGRGLQEGHRFRGQFYIEPKPKEPTKHQYDSDAAACLNFLREHDLLDDFKLNLETNHATLAGHTMQHELEVAIAAEALGSIDANTGDLLLGWDTDQFPTSIYLATEIMLSILGMGGFKTGGTNFDAKVRRKASSRWTCFTHTSAAWTPSRAGSRPPPPSARTAGWPTS